MSEATISYSANMYDYTDYHNAALASIQAILFLQDKCSERKTDKAWNRGEHG